ncbi:hypothetical protein RJT34_23564 [Clitoria ternatea]|uniref:Uncharacterized protein n=1 Tax=Clitoria ternatea TaxID=43366 RepID=A0AAN9FLF9_CLITE
MQGKYSIVYLLGCQNQTIQFNVGFFRENDIHFSVGIVYMLRKLQVDLILIVWHILTQKSRFKRKYLFCFKTFIGCVLFICSRLLE